MTIWDGEATEMLDTLYEHQGLGPDAIAEKLTQRFRTRFTRGMVDGKIKREKNRGAITPRNVPWSARWPAERCEMLQKLWNDNGLSASQIADSFSRTYREYFTRMMVLGKVHRLKEQGWHFVERGQGRRMKGSQNTPRKRRTHKSVKAETAVVAKKQPARKPPTKPAEPEAPPSDPVTFAELNMLPADVEPRFKHCRWPVGDGVGDKMEYCGRKPFRSDEPYCEHHRRIAWTGKGAHGTKPSRSRA